MTLDVNKIISESIKEVITETTGGAVAGTLLGAGSTISIPLPGSTIAGGIAGGISGSKISEHLKTPGEKISDATEEAKEKLKSAGKKVAASAEEVKEKAASIGKKVVDIVKENPGISAAAAAALAAGVGALALRKKLKKAK